MYTKNRNIEIMRGIKIDEIIKNLFGFFLENYQKSLEEPMRSSEFVPDSFDLYYHFQKIGLKRGRSYIDSLKWFKNKQATTNQENNDDYCFQHALTVVSNYQIIENNPQRISKIKLFIDRYNWKEIDFPSHSKNWKMFEQNNQTIALNILFVPNNTEKIKLEYKSNDNFKRENQAILLMITDGTKWHYLAVKRVLALPGGITSNHN